MPKADISLHNQFTKTRGKTGTSLNICTALRGNFSRARKKRKDPLIYHVAMDCLATIQDRNRLLLSVTSPLWLLEP